MWRRCCRIRIDVILISGATFSRANHLHVTQCLDSCCRNDSLWKYKVPLFLESSPLPFKMSFFPLESCHCHFYRSLELRRKTFSLFFFFQNGSSTTSITALTAKPPFWDNDDHYLLTTYLFICSRAVAQPAPLMWDLPIWQDAVDNHNGDLSD